jgi:hypothetical protein
MNTILTITTSPMIQTSSLNNDNLKKEKMKSGILKLMAGKFFENSDQE